MFNEYPYRNLTDLNLDYILNAIKTFQSDVTNFVSINAIKYANPIQWNITSQYEKNTIVIDPVSGTAYISVAPVPSGVALTREDYWTVVFDLSLFIVRAAKNFTNRYEAETTTTATFTTPAGGWLVWGDTLYVANVNITAGDSYVIDSNITHITMEEVKNAVYQVINDNYDAILNIIGSLEDLDTVNKTNLVAAINEVISSIGNLENLSTEDKSNVVAAINEVISNVNDRIDEINGTIGKLEDLTTEDKSNVVSAINEVNGIAKRNNRFYKLSDLEELTPANIQDIIDNYDIIDVDVNLDLGSASLVLRSNVEMYSSNGSVIKGSSRIFTIAGTRSEVADANLTFSDRNHATFTGNMLNNREYMLVSDQTAVGADAYGVIGYPNYMGGGTENNANAFPMIFTNVTISGANCQTNVPTYAIFNTAKAYLFEPIFGVHVHDIDIDSSENVNAHMRANIPIEVHNAANCLLENIRITVGYGNCITVAASHDIIVRGCSATALNSDFIDHYHNNVYRIAAGYQVIIENCSGVGSQPYDITYRGADPYVSAYCIVKNCQSFANYTCLTTHPGSWKCIIDSLNGYTFGANNADGISLRGSLHLVTNCHLTGEREALSYGIGSVEGCVTHKIVNNSISGFRFAFLIHEATDRPFSDRGTPSELISGNYCDSCGTFLRLHKENALSNFGVGASITNNTLRNSVGAYTEEEIIRCDGVGTGNFQFIQISDLMIYNKKITTFIKNDGSFTVKRSNIEIKVAYSSSIDLSYTGTIDHVYASVKGGQISNTTVVGTQLPPIVEYIS